MQPYLYTTAEISNDEKDCVIDFTSAPQLISQENGFQDRLSKEAVTNNSFSQSTAYSHKLGIKGSKEEYISVYDCCGKEKCICPEDESVDISDDFEYKNFYLVK